MIKKTQVRFVATTMVIVLAVLSAIYGVSCIIVGNATNSSVMNALDVAEKTYLSDGHHIKNSLIVEINYYNEVSPETVRYTYTCDDKNSFFSSDEKIHDYVIKILSQDREYGSFDNLYYHIRSPYDVKYVAAYDATAILASKSNQILQISLFFLTVLIIIAVIVYIASFSVVSPVKETLGQQRQFISDASHELKTPLTIISANADVLHASDDDNEWVNNIRSQVDRMQTLIEDLLTLAKIDEDRVKLSPEEFSLSDEITACALPFDALVFEKEKSLTLDVQPNVIVKSDRASVRKITGILLDNAVKYSAPHGEIIVSLKKETKTTLSVYNDGSEIDANDTAKLFERFYRGDNSRTRETGGTGLGLSIAKTIADANKWKISATSEKGKFMKITVIM